MTAYVDQSYYGWSHEELPEQNEFQEVSNSQMLDHGSISFGRYACEPLSWEKRSVFTFNKHQEELEKFKSNGLVAKKKAYFEEYYKKIRAMKALQESQQTEITLDYSDSASGNTSQTEEEKVPIENPIKPVEKSKDEVEAKCGLTTSYSNLSSNNNIATQYSDIGSNASQTEGEIVPTENSVKLVEKCKHKVEAQCGLTSSCSDLSSSLYINTSHTEEGKIPIKKSVKLVEKLEDEVEAQCELTILGSDFDSTGFVVNKQQDEIGDTSQKNLEVDVAVNQSLEVSSKEPKQIEIHHPEDKEASRENSFPVTKVELDVVAKEPKSVSENSSACNMKIKSAQEMLVPRKVPPAVRKSKDTKTVAKMKEPSAPAKISSKLERDAKLDPGKSSNASKTIRKADVKSGIGVESSIKIADEVPKTYKCTNSRPSSRAINKRASTSSQGRELSSKTKRSSTVKEKEPIKAKTTIHTTLNISQEENTTKLTVTTNIIKSKRTEEKRINEQVEKPPTAKVENRISLKERDTNAIGSSKNRSSSLPPRDRIRSTGVSDMGSKAKMDVDKREVTRQESKMTKASRVDTKSITSKVTRQGSKHGTGEASEVKKVARPRVCGSRQGFGEQSQNSRKNSEKEKPRWR